MEPIRITRVETIPLSKPLKHKFSGSHYAMSRRSCILTRVYTDAGIVGECYNNDEHDSSQKNLVTMIHSEIVPHVLGMDVFNVEGIWERMRGPSYNILRPRWYAMMAQACIDSAVWDALGKALNRPLWQLWGGFRDTLPVTATAGYYVDGRDAAYIAEEIEGLRRLGYGGCKFKVGGKSPKEDAERVRIAREAAGPDFIITADANQAWELRDAIDFARRAEKYDIRWFEEPVRWYDEHRNLATIRAITGMPVGAGQSEISRVGCRDMMMAGAIDVCNLDVSGSGGPTEWRRVAAMAKCFDVQMAHHAEGHIAMHLIGAIAHGTFLEIFPPERDPMFYEMVLNRSPIRDGKYSIAGGPGYGLVLDEGFIKKYRVD